jgi:hypothetical protein
MANILKTGSDWLAQRLEDTCASPIVVSLSTGDVTVDAVYARTVDEDFDGQGTRTLSRAVDFVVSEEALPVPPDKGDYITADGVRYEVTEFGQDANGWRWTDSHRNSRRIHTREVSSDD